MAKKGKVTLVGAGPGDAMLLTLKSIDVILKADVVVYDRLVAEEIITIIPEHVEKINVGKESNHHHIKQELINEILLRTALEGKNVVRLKGGDPFVFGRGGEELELLAKYNIDFEVVPGVSSAIAALTYGGIPVTHRDHSSSIHIITGHSRANGVLNINFKALVDLSGTIIFMMGVATIDELMKGLIEAGIELTTPAAIIENGTRKNQRKVISNVQNIAEESKKNKIHSPSVIAVGKVCALSEKFDWFKNTLI